MPATQSGPDFERSPDQRVIPGSYQEPTPTGVPDAAPTLRERLRAVVTRTGRRRGPSFRKPKDWATWPDTEPAAKKPRPRRRPHGFTLPEGEGKP